jgi:F0F1-type ATP synthase membrane subunit a
MHWRRSRRSRGHARKQRENQQDCHHEPRANQDRRNLPADPTIPDERITLRSFAEVLVEGLRNFIGDLLGARNLGSYVNFFGTLFLFILTANFLGLVPGMEPPTADTDFTWALAVIVFAYYLYEGFKHQGPSYLKSFLGPMRSLAWLPLMVFMLVIEIVGNLTRPFSLGIRLFANSLLTIACWEFLQVSPDS